MAGEPIDITTHTHSHFEERIQKLEKRIVRMEKWHVAQERFYGVVRERDLLTHLMSDMESKVDSIRQSPNYREYPKKGFQSGYELNNESGEL